MARDFKTECERQLEPEQHPLEFCNTLIHCDLFDMPTQGSVPSNFYFVQSRLPWNFRENAKEYIAMDKVVTPDQFPDEFATVYEKMKEIMIKGDVRGAPEPLTLEVAEARQRETGRSIKQNIMVAVMLFTVPTGCFAEMIDISTRTPVNGGEFLLNVPNNSARICDCRKNDDVRLARLSRASHLSFCFDQVFRPRAWH